MSLSSWQPKAETPPIVLAELIQIIRKDNLNVQMEQVLATVQKHYTIIVCK